MRAGNHLSCNVSIPKWSLSPKIWLFQHGDPAVRFFRSHRGSDLGSLGYKWMFVLSRVIHAEGGEKGANLSKTVELSPDKI